MSFKVHLIIICAIVVFTYIILQVIRSEPTTRPTTVQIDESPYRIMVVHASWGLNCRARYIREFDVPPDAFASEEEKKVREDNVLEPVQKLCQGTESCTIALNEEVLGADPDPDCQDKDFKIEYRCFTYDRPWVIVSREPQVTIDCKKQNDKKK